MKVKKFANFFDKFPQFDYDADARISDEFGRPGKTRNWNRGSKTWRINWNLCIVSQYQCLVGSHANTLVTWQVICKKAGIEDEFTKALANVYVNVIDLLECWETNKIPRSFRNDRELAEYSMPAGKVYPREAAKQDSVLRVLLKQLQ